MKSLICKNVLLIAGIVLIGSLSGCEMSKRSTAGDTTEKPGKTQESSENKKTGSTCTLVLFDQSVGSDAVREMYRKNFKDKIAYLKKMKPNDRILGDILTDRTEQTASFPIDIYLPKFDFLKDSQVVYDAKNKKEITQQLEIANKLISGKAPNSDIIGGFVLAGRIFHSEKSANADCKRLIIFTDAIQQTPQYDFTKKSICTDKEIDRIIEKEKSDNRIPDLSGVDVYMVGVNAQIDAKLGMQTEQLAWIEKFWVKYIAETHAKFSQARYAPNLIDL